MPSNDDLVRDMTYEIACLDDNRRYLSVCVNCSCCIGPLSISSYTQALHVYCLANMLRRPIVVFAKENPNGLMRGIYLPTL
jgi:hypothetical protein